jgi:hypothetical protein
MGSKGVAAPVLAAVVALGLAACGEGGGASTGIEDAKPAIIFRVSGGLAGISEELQILSDRTAILTSGRRADITSTSHFSITDAEYANLRDELNAAKLDSLPKPGPTGCADCFEYRISYHGTYSADDVSLPARLRPAINTLSGLIATHGKDAGASILGGK